jgi:BlaI family transcriptional regulator, penicillinase repressor
MKFSAPCFFRGKLVGPLEQRMLSHIWQCGSGTVREIEKAERYRLAHTTVMTTLDRLFKKGLLGRSQEGPAFRYKPIVSQADFLKSRAVHAWQSLLDAAPDSNLALSFLVNKVGEEDSQMLRELERLVERKRREIGRLKRGTA